MVKFRMLVATMLVGCGGTAFSAADAPLHEDGGAAETSSVETDSGAGMLDHRVLSPEGSQEAGVGHDAAPGNDAGPVFNEAATTHDAQADAGDAPNGCADDLSNIQGGDFHIDFDVLTGKTGGSGPLLRQQSNCSDPYMVHWLINVSGNILVELGDGTKYVELMSVAFVDDSVWHHIAVVRLSGAMSITIDGHIDNSLTNAGLSISTALPPLQIGLECSSPAVFAGQIKNVCVARQ